MTCVHSGLDRHELALGIVSRTEAGAFHDDHCAVWQPGQTDHSADHDLRLCLEEGTSGFRQVRPQPVQEAPGLVDVGLGLIFLKYISDAFEERRQDITVALSDPESGVLVSRRELRIADNVNEPDRSQSA